MVIYAVVFVILLVEMKFILNIFFNV